VFEGLSSFSLLLVIPMEVEITVIEENFETINNLEKNPELN